ncbi:ferrochelatase [Actinobaculum sp. 313]|uniref:ferrochelatase n=1 Tax=Actinobaculum sp. 313 TaxID=2495645 RepID=UPI001F0BF136|nr:ferrochelatase [Actinobaculum sp. 313]
MAAPVSADSVPQGDSLSPYTAVVLTSYGGPRKSEDVLPFMRNATAGRGIPDERLLEVSQHYELFGGRSPINEQNEALRDALEDELARRGCPRPVLIGNRNWTPFVSDAVADLRAAGHRRVIALPTAAYSSYSGCRQYREDLERATAQVPGIVIDKAGPYAERPGFISANADALASAVRSLRSRIRRGTIKVLFVTHSIPTAMNAASADGTEPARYDAQHMRVAAAVAQAAAELVKEDLDWELVYCSRSGNPHTPWLEPDVNDRLHEIAAANSSCVTHPALHSGSNNIPDTGSTRVPDAHSPGGDAARAIAGVVAAPIGFISDHMEVAFDLDTQARATAADLGLEYQRAATAGTHPDFVSTLADLLADHAAFARGDKAIPDHPCLQETVECCLPRPPV